MTWTDPGKPRLRLRATWGKNWALQWARRHLRHVQVPGTLAGPGTFEECWRVVEGTQESIKAVLKPNNATHSQGVLYVRTADVGDENRSDGWRPAVWDRHRAKHFIDVTTGRAREIVSPTLKRPPGAFQWILEELIEAHPYSWTLFGPGLDAAQNVLDGFVVPPAVFRVILWKGAFHFGEIHVPTSKSGGVGSLRRGAIRYVFDSTGTVRRPPKLKQAPDWIPVCDGRAWAKHFDDWQIPGWDSIRADLETVLEHFGHLALYAFDFVLGADEDGQPRPYFIEIEHNPNVRYLVQFKGFRDGSR